VGTKKTRNWDVLASLCLEIRDYLFLDVNECEADPNPCNKANEECKNTPGHYSCECKDGYRRNFDTDECELDVQGENLIFLTFFPIYHITIFAFF
jgi:hypothetical protein